MTIKTTLPAIIAVSLLLGVCGAGCKKDPDPNATPDASDTTAIGAVPSASASAAAGAVASYPDMVQQSGTKQLLQPFTVYQAADTTSPVLTRVAVGQWVNLKASHGNWMLIDWPSGVGQMSPGWIQLNGINDNRLSSSPPAAAVDAGAKDAGIVVALPGPVDAGAPPAADAGRRGIIIRPRPH